MAILLFYDLTSHHKRIKLELEKEGYLDYFTHAGIKYYLPNKTLWHAKESLSPEKALKQLEDVIKSVNLTISPKIELTRGFSSYFSLGSWAAIPGKPPTL